MTSVLMIASLILHGVYAVLPVCSLGVFQLRGCLHLRRTIITAWISGIILTGAVLGVSVASTGGMMSYAQAGLAIYWGVSLMLLLKGMDWILRIGVRKLTPDNDTGYRSFWRWGIHGLRVMLFAGFTLPWVMSAVMVYRPKVVSMSVDSPASVLNLDYETIGFRTPDGIRIAGWWIPSTSFSTTTVVFCHGLGASKASAWTMLRMLHDAGVHVLTIDLRAHGSSGGQLSTFGASEWQDVIGAVNYLKSHLPNESHRLIVVGASIGGASAIEATASDPRIDGVVVIGSFSSLSDVSRDISNRYMIFPLNLLARYLAMPMACLHSGYNLFEVNPGNRVQAVWPRPVMVIHGFHDEIVPFEQGRKLYEKAFFPRWSKFVVGTHNEVLDDPAVIKDVVDFVLNSESNAVVQTETVCREPAGR